MLIIMLRSVLRIVKYIMFFCITIALISIILVYYYQKYDSKNVPTIVHNNKLTKIQPKDSGGLILPNSERLIYDHLQINSHKKNDKIIFLPEPEYPINFINQVNRNDILNQIIYNINSKDIKTNKKSTKLNIIKTERTYNKLQTNAIHHNKNKCYVIELGSVKSINSAKKETEKLKRNIISFFMIQNYLIQKLTIIAIIFI